MKIKYKEYTLEPEGQKFNLYKTVPCKIKGVESTKEEIMGWAKTFESCIDAIIKDKKASTDEILTFNQYLNEYKKLKNEILLTSEE